jgi:hypothetical protein
MTRCNKVLQAVEGGLWPRTCAKCGLGPCSGAAASTPAGWSGYLKSRSSDGVTATINVVLLRGLIEAAEADIRADERERMAVVIGKRFCGGEIIAEAIRSQDNN